MIKFLLIVLTLTVALSASAQTRTVYAYSEGADCHTAEAKALVLIQQQCHSLYEDLYNYVVKSCEMMDPQAPLMAVVLEGQCLKRL